MMGNPSPEGEDESALEAPRQFGTRLHAQPPAFETPSKTGLTAREYAAKAGLNPGTLKFWKYTLGRESRSSSGEGTNFPLMEVLSSAARDDRFKVQLEGGHRVRVPGAFDVDALTPLDRRA